MISDINTERMMAECKENAEQMLDLSLIDFETLFD